MEPAPRTSVCVLLLTAVALLMAGPHVFPLTSLGMFSYDSTDAGILLWDFWWTKDALQHLHTPYWTSLLFYPHGTSLALHAYPMPYCIESLPVQFLVPGTRGLLIAFNVVVLGSFVLNALGAYALAARVSGSRAGGMVAGAIFAFMPFRFLNVARLYLITTEFLVGYVLCWVLFTAKPSRPRAIALAVALALCLYSAPEYAIVAVVFSVLWLLFHWQSRSGSPRPALGRRLVFAGVVFAVLTSPVLYLQARSLVARQTNVSRSIGEVVTWSPALVSFFTPSRVHPMYGKWLAAAGEYGTPGVLGMRSETTIALTAWVLALVGLRRMKRDGSTFWAIAAGLFLALALGPFLRLTGTWLTRVPLPYVLLYNWLPPLRASRDPTRMLPMAMLMMSVLAAFGVRSCLNRLTSRTSAAVVTALLVCLVLFESLTVWPSRAGVDQLLPSMYERIAAVREEFAVLDLRKDQLALFAQTLHGKPITAGTESVPRSAWSGQMLALERDFRQPEGVLTLDPAGRAARLDADRDEFKRLNFRFVVFPTVSEMQATFATAMGLRPVAETGSLLWVVEEHARIP